jgi:hypothetical protein
VGLWLSAAAALPQDTEILRARIRENPTDIYNMRLEQQLGSREERAVVCARHGQLAAASPANAALQYIAARCIIDREAQSNRFLELHARWPRNAWLTFGAAYTLASRGKWQDAAPLHDQARSMLPGMFEELTVESGRLHRLIDGSSSELAVLSRESQLLHTVSFADLPQTQPLCGLAVAYYKMAHGGLQEALDAASGLRGFAAASGCFGWWLLLMALSRR